MGKRVSVCLAGTIAAVACIVTLALILVVVDVEAGPLSPEAEGADRVSSPLPPGVDLDVTFISRTPLYRAYCVHYLYDAPDQSGRPILCPGTEDERRWPEPGETVTFTAHVVNKGTAASPAFDYAWYVDGVERAGDTLPALAPAEEVTATLQWPWPHDLSLDGQRALGEHTVRFAADPADAVAETYESNNSLVMLGFDGNEFSYLDSYGAYLNSPTGVAVDTWGHVVVADTGNSRVVVLTSEGEFLAEYTEPNDGYSGPFNAPRGVAIQANGDLVVADTGNQRVVSVRGALPGQWGAWLPLVARNWQVE